MKLVKLNNLWPPFSIGQGTIFELMYQYVKLLPKFIWNTRLITKITYHKVKVEE